VANEENNPGRQAVWTKPYVDYMGTGWMVSCSSPLYLEDRFLGVACTDVKLDTLKSNFLEDFRLSDSGFACLLDNEGNIIYHPDYLPVGDQQGQMFLANIIKDASVPEEYKIAWKKILSDDQAGAVSYYDSTDGNQKKLIAFAPVEGLDWTLAVEVDYDDFMAVNKIEPTNLVIYILIVIIALLFFSMFLYRQYSKPIILLRNEAWNIAAGHYNNFESPSNLTEIKALSDAFNSMSRDIKEFTDNLIQKNKEIESIINSIGGLLMIINPEYDIILLNDKGKSIFKDKTSDVAGKKCYSVLLNRTSPCKGCKVHQVLSDKTPSYTRMAIKDEIISNSYFPILNKSKKIVEVVVHSQKITKSVLMEKELIQQEKLAGIGQISSAIAHELKTPLAVIKGASYLLKVYTKEHQDPRVVDTIQSISSTVENAEKTIYNLLDYSGQGKGIPEQIDVTKVINQILFLSNKERIQKNIDTDVSFSQEPLLYFGQAEPIKIMLQNIISNAIKALPEGGLLKIEGRYIREGNTLEITVSDNGRGIPKSLRGNLFKPFFTTDTSGKGTGLGLWITKIMVEKMNGEILLQTKEGEGTKFTLHLPLTDMKGVLYES
jgi:signal transduction histidine kinase